MLRILLALLLAALCSLGLAREPWGMSSDIPLVSQAELPFEARQTLRLIEQGGPFPYHRDGITFGNYEKRLPLRPRAYYREYTVPTPGERDRGARRIISGNGGERYYTADHYQHFWSIRP